MRSPLLGYNHNLKYRGRVYHIQTEDSGESNPHIFTHLFHNGIIVSTRKTEYGHLLGAEDVEEQVRKLMQLQHKDMMKSLLGGQFDEKIVRYFGTLNGEEQATTTDKETVAETTPASLPPIPVIKKPEKTTAQSAQPMVSAAFIKEETKLGFGPAPSGPAKSSTKPLKEQPVADLGPTTVDYGDLTRTHPIPANETEKNEPVPSVVIARPAIILTGDENTGFGSFAANTQRPSVGKSKKVVDPFEVPDTFLEISSLGKSQSANNSFPERNSQPATPTTIPPLTTPDMRLTGPIQAPPGLFKPENSKEIPDDLVRLNTSDTRVDDIILDFLMAESLAKLGDDNENQ